MESLEDWYLARLRKIAVAQSAAILESPKTPKALVSADKLLIKQLVAREGISPELKEPFAQEAKARQLHLESGLKYLPYFGVLGALIMICSVFSAEKRQDYFFWVLSLLYFLLITFAFKYSGRIKALAHAVAHAELTLKAIVHSSGLTAASSDVDALSDQMETLVLQLRQAQSVIVDYSPEIICCLDQDGAITQINLNAENIWGHPLLSLITKPLIELCSADEQDAFLRYLDKCKIGSEKEADERYEFSFLKVDGSKIDLSWTLEWSTSLSCYFGSASDISERRQIERLKADLNTMVSHDLRAPINGISLVIQGLLAGTYGEISEQGKTKLRACLENIDRMLKLISQNLNLEQIESGQLPLYLQVTKTSSIIDAAVKFLKPIAEGRGIQFNLNNAEPAVEVLADPEKSAQVLTNILSNAIKFSPENGIIDIRVTEMDAFASIEVIDRGPGIPSEFEASVFERFKKLDRNDLNSGSGFGMYMARQLVESQGGQIGFERDESTGTCFWFTLKKSS